MAGYGASQFKVALLKLTKGEEKKYPLKFEGAELILYWTALDFGHEVVKKKAPAPNLAALPPMPDEAEVERQFVEVAVCDFTLSLISILIFFSVTQI